MSKKSNKIEIDILSDISDIQEGHNQVIPIVTENEDELSENYSIPESLPILSLRSSVLFPGSITPITVGREKSMKLIRDVEAGTGILGAVLQKESDVEQPAPDDMYRIGTAARILKTLDMPNGNLTVILHGLEKIEINEYLSSEPYFTATVTPLKDTTPASGNVEFEALVESIKDVALNIISVSPNIPKEASFAIKNIDSKRGIINFICSNLDFEDADRQRLLEAPGLLARARRLLEILVREQQLVELKNKIQSKVKQDIDQQQKEYYLQQQIRTIQEELGGNEDEAEIARMREEAKTKKWSKEVGEMFNKELNKLERLNPAVAEYSVQMNYLQLMLELPWGECTQDNLDLKHACERLDNDHFGLEEVKERLLEHHQAERRPQVADYLPLRPSRSGQDVARQIGGGSIGPQVRTHIARRPARRIGNPRPQAHLHRRDAGPHHPDHQAMRLLQPGHHPRRGGQNRRREPR